MRLPWGNGLPRMLTPQPRFGILIVRRHYLATPLLDFYCTPPLPRTCIIAV